MSERMDETGEIDASDVIKIMVATDNHLGYCEKDAVRGEDSFTAFEEILAMAVEEDVDFILLGGDLFHDAVPSHNSLHKCMKLLRQYIYGDKEITFEVLSEQSLNFHGSINDTVNFEDPNLNISIPIFSIHGNHDDPSTFGQLSTLDLLSTSGMVNYIGRWADLNKVEVKPLIIRKGLSQLAIYGLSHIHDERLARLFETYKVEIERPAGEKDDWFHLMVLHQNRAMRGRKNFLPEDILPEFLNLVVWGHEHDCRVEPEHVPKRDFYISQPGSSVATSLSEGEAIKKHVGILEIHKNKFKLQPMPLQTVRPFIFESIDLDDIAADGSLDGADAADKVRELAEKRIEEMIERSKQLLTGHPNQPKLPLIRLRLVFTREEHMFNAIRFGQTYNEKVANPGDMVHFKKAIKRIKPEDVGFDKKAFNKAFENIDIDANSRLEDLLERYFDDVDDNKKLKVMPTKLVSEITFQMVQRGDIAAADKIISNYENKVLDRLMEAMPNEDEIDNYLKEIQSSITAEDITELLRVKEQKSVIPAPAPSRSTAKKRKVNVVEEEEEDVMDSDDMLLMEVKKVEAKTTTRGRGGRGRGRGARGATNANTTSPANSRTTRTAYKPELNVTINSNRQSPRQAKNTTSSGLESLVGTRSSSRKTNNIYVISDDSD